MAPPGGAVVPQDAESSRIAALKARGFRVRMVRDYSSRPSVATLIATAPNLQEIGILLGAVRLSSTVCSTTVRKCERAAQHRIEQLLEAPVQAPATA